MVVLSHLLEFLVLDNLKDPEPDGEGGKHHRDEVLEDGEA
jgi:hypothetical protein